MNPTVTRWMCLDETAASDAAVCLYEDDRDERRAVHGGHQDCGEFVLCPVGSDPLTLTITKDENGKWPRWATMLVEVWAMLNRDNIRAGHSFLDALMEASSE